jgi:DNA-binding transcriptional LysR family regulator
MKRLGQLSLRQLRAQAAAVRHRSISAAAEELLLSPLAIYSQLNQLEETFGCALLRRSGVEALDATTEGAALIAAYCEARSAVERAVQKVDALTRGGCQGR